MTEETLVPPWPTPDQIAAFPAGPQDQPAVMPAPKWLFAVSGVTQ